MLTAAECRYVVQVLGQHPTSEEVGADVMAARQRIVTRYDELKKKLDYFTAAEDARAEWLCDWLREREG